MVDDEAGIEILKTAPPAIFLALMLKTLPVKVEVVAITLNTLPDVRVVEEMEAIEPVAADDRIEKELVEVLPAFESTR